MKEARPTAEEERIQIAKDCIANGGNYGETALKFNVSYQQVYQWVKKFKEKGEAGLEDRRGKRLKDQTPRTREEELEIEIAKLKHELYMTKMERDVLKKYAAIDSIYSSISSERPFCSYFFHCNPITGMIR